MLEEPLISSPKSVAIQSVLYRTPLEAIERTLEALDNSARIGTRDGYCSALVIVLGDASPSRLVDDSTLARWKTDYANLADIRYTFFDDNVGTSRGHNALATMADTDFLVTSNPDVVPYARALWRMLAAFEDDTVGMVEAKQLPIEHPKDYDSATGFTSWATTAFAMTRRTLFDQLGGFDAETFFMYCDDVDYSWRVWEAQASVVFQPAAVVFHDKTLTTKGKWMPTGAESFFSAQASLLLAHKWSRDDVVERVLAVYESMEQDAYQAAAAEFKKRRDEGTLVARHDEANVVATFVDDFYAKHRYSL